MIVSSTVAVPIWLFMFVELKEQTRCVLTEILRRFVEARVNYLVVVLFFEQSFKFSLSVVWMECRPVNSVSTKQRRPPNHLFLGDRWWLLAIIVIPALPDSVLRFKYKVRVWLQNTTGVVHCMSCVFCQQVRSLGRWALLFPIPCHEAPITEHDRVTHMSSCHWAGIHCSW